MGQAKENLFDGAQFHRDPAQQDGEGVAVIISPKIVLSFSSGRLLRPTASAVLAGLLANALKPLAI
jgi:hypothetical protein